LYDHHCLNIVAISTLQQGVQYARLWYLALLLSASDHHS
jgi:hypothetical protein